MKLTELQEHRARFLQAFLNGHQVGLADEYVTAFEKYGVVTKGPRGSAEHLFALADNALNRYTDRSDAPPVVQAPIEPAVATPAPVVDTTPVETPVVETEGVTEETSEGEGPKVEAEEAPKVEEAPKKPKRQR